MTYIRKNAWNNGGDFTNEDLLWYAKGVQKMMGRALDDPASWWFFAAIHGEYVDPGTPWYQKPPAFPDWGFIEAPPAVPTQPLPKTETREAFWNQCQHGTWYFLPWHRGYLFALEAQLRADIVSLGGPKDWALPYWDYFGANKQYRMPPAFSQEMLDGAPNPLYCKMRYGPNDGGVYIPTPAWEADNPDGPKPIYGEVTDSCMANDVYTGSDAVTPKPGFGGPETGFEHSGSPHGNMESNPHDLVHVYIGGELSATDYGLMSDPGTAALDPIFYLHHCNIDRMWAQWNASGNANPTDGKWLDGPTRQFVMPTPDGKSWAFTPRQVSNLQELGYSYQELAALEQPAARLLARRLQRLGAANVAAEVDKGVVALASPKPPELLGASAPTVAIQGTGARNVPVRMDSGIRKKLSASLTSISAMSLPDRVYLKLENVRGTRDATVLNVFVKGDGAQAGEQRANLAGQVALFGMRRASVKDGEHGGGGLTFVLDITRIVDQLHLDGALDVASLAVSLVPRHALSAGETITVGRVSVYRQGSA